MSNDFLYSQSVVTKRIKNGFLTILNKFLDDIDDLFDIYSSENSISNHLFHEVLKWTCILGSSKCNDHINATLELHFNNTARWKLLETWQKWIYCQGLMNENITYETSIIWFNLLFMYIRQKRDVELYELLPCSTINENVLPSLYALSHSVPHAFVLHENINISKSGTVTFLFTMFSKHSKNVDTLSSILQAIEKIGREININIVAAASCIINYKQHIFRQRPGDDYR
ncbi:uncharacterized protein LOC109862679 isoform X2 [Pseudomyrmex gracilis]|nr:uncharacterized protein LOC109862679 isoform X2 [Pseudomyrmex gracilis]